MTTCTSGQDFFKCTLHSVLGWMAWYKPGYLHRDISIGNILKLDPPAERPPFVVPELEELFCNFAAINSSAELPEWWTEVKEARDHLVKAVKGIDVGTICRAIVTDGDGVTNMTDSDPFNGQHRGTLSGTEQFRSVNFSTNLSREEGYLQGPLDDMESFVWTAQWALVFNPMLDYVEEARDWRQKLLDAPIHRVFVLDRSSSAGRRWKERTQSGHDICDGMRLVASVAPVLKEWREKIEHEQGSWVETLTFTPKRGSPWYQCMFHKMSLRGLADTITILHKALQDTL